MEGVENTDICLKIYKVKVKSCQEIYREVKYRYLKILFNYSDKLFVLGHFPSLVL